MKNFKFKKRIRIKHLQTRQDRILTLSNAISMSRIIMAVPLVMLFEDIAKGDVSKFWLAFGLIVVIVVSDFLDGYVARKAEEITHFGKLIDPVADKVCMMVVMIYLIIIYKLPFLIFFLMLAIRDTFLIIIGVYLMFSQNEVFQSNRSGKWFMGITAFMMVLFLFKQLFNIHIYLLWTAYFVSILLFVFSTFEYIKRYMRYFKRLESL